MKFFTLFLILSGVKPKKRAIKIANSISIKIPKVKANGIQRGEVTHHQDQSMLCVNFSTKKIMNSKLGSPIPVVDLDFIILIFL